MAQRVRSELPTDVETLQRMLLDANEKVAILTGERDEKQAEIVRLTLLIAKLRRMQFGRSSEKLDGEIAQLELLLEELQMPSPTMVAARRALPDPPVDPTPKAWPEHLPREERRHVPDSACATCGGALRQIGEDVAEQIEYLPARFKVIRHVRPKFACRGCETIIQGEAPSRPIARGIAGPGLLAQVLVSKYADHLPLYRQSQIYARDGVELSRSTLADWVGQCSALMAPLVEKIAEHALQAGVLHADDTPIPVLAPGGGKTATARLWTYVRDGRPAGDTTPPAVVFRYTPDRKGEHPQRHLADFRGVLQADGYAGFHHLYRDGQIHEAACWAHVRRKFYEFAETAKSPIATDIVERIAGLYVVETQARGQPPDVRVELRRRHSAPILDGLRQALLNAQAKLSKKSELAKAIGYTLPRWPALTRYLDDGTIEIDNNAAERSLRGVAMGRKNWLFAGSHAGGERAAQIYTLIGTAKLNDVEPFAYLRYVLERIADHPINRIDELPPWNVAALLMPIADQTAAA